jgi:uncharacterized membrane protein
MKNQFREALDSIIPTEVTLAFLLLGIPVVGGGIAYAGRMALGNSLLDIILAIIIVITILTEQYFSRRHLPSILAAMFLAIFVLYTPIGWGAGVVLVLLGYKIIWGKRG